MWQDKRGRPIAEKLVAIIEPSVELPEEDFGVVAAHTELGNTFPLIALSTGHILIKEQFCLFALIDGLAHHLHQLQSHVLFPGGCIK